MTDVGISIKEGVANGASPFKDPSMRNVGLLGMFTRGPKLVPTKVSNMEEFNEMFGGQNSNYFGPAVVKNLFDEAGEAPVTLYLSRVVSADSVVASKELSATTAVTLQCKAGYKGTPDPGAWANNKVNLTFYPFGVYADEKYALAVSYNGSTETYIAGTIAEIVSQVNTASKCITVAMEGTEETGNARYKVTSVGSFTAKQGDTQLTGSAAPTGAKAGDTLYSASYEKIGVVASVSGNNILLQGMALVDVSGTVSKLTGTLVTGTLTGGTDGNVTEDYFGDQFNSFDGADVQIMAHTEYHSLDVEKKFNAYLNEQKSPIGVITFPVDFSESMAELYYNALRSNDKSFMAGGYEGWITVLDSDGNRVTIPNIGAVIGAAYLRTPYASGNYIHIPPGGLDSLFTTVVDVTPRSFTQATINRLVQNYLCNVLQYVEDTGWYVGTSRSYSTNSLYQSIHTRLQTSYYVRVLKNKLRFMEQKPNTPSIRQEALVELRTYFKGEYDAGALENSVAFDKAYQAICDKSNNPAGQDRKLVNITVMWIPTECIESVVLSLQRNDGILLIEEE